MSTSDTIVEILKEAKETGYEGEFSPPLEKALLALAAAIDAKAAPEKPAA